MGSDDAIVGRIFTRREALLAAIRTSAGFAIATVVAKHSLGSNIPTTQPHLPLIAAPALTEGPFFVDEKLNRSNLLAGTDRPSVINGLPLLLSMTVYKLAGKTVTPMPNVMIDVWHADAVGAYSDESNPMNHEDTSKQSWLRGYQMTDALGAVEFATIFPGWYEGRTPHIHFKVRQLPDSNAASQPATAKEFTSQLFFRESDSDRIYSQEAYKSTRGQRDTTNESDDVFSEQLADGSAAGAAMLLDLALHPSGNGFAANFPVILTDASMHSGRGHDFGGPHGDHRPGDGPPDGGPPDWFGPDDIGPPPGPPPRPNGRRPSSRPANR